jgi:hypothetical protein
MSRYGGIEMKSLAEILAEPDVPIKKNLTDSEVAYISKLKYRTACPKCNGTGFLSEYGHVKNGKCFMCNGKGELK